MEINVYMIVRIEIIKLIQTPKLSASSSATKIAKCGRQPLSGKREKGILPIFLFLHPLVRSVRRENSRDIDSPWQRGAYK